MARTEHPPTNATKRSWDCFSQKKHLISQTLDIVDSLWGFPLNHYAQRNNPEYLHTHLLTFKDTVLEPIKGCWSKNVRVDAHCSFSLISSNQKRLPLFTWASISNQIQISLVAKFICKNFDFTTDTGLSDSTLHLRPMNIMEKFSTTSFNSCQSWIQQAERSFLFVGKTRFIWRLRIALLQASHNHHHFSSFEVMDSPAETREKSDNPALHRNQLSLGPYRLNPYWGSITTSAKVAWLSGLLLSTTVPGGTWRTHA